MICRRVLAVRALRSRRHRRSCGRTKLRTVLPKRTITIIFIVTVHATTLPLFTTSGVTERGDLTGAAWIVIGLATGRLSGLLGIGGGVVMVPAMIIGLGMFPVAPATKHAQSDRWMD